MNRPRPGRWYAFASLLLLVACSACGGSGGSGSASGGTTGPPTPSQPSASTVASASGAATIVGAAHGCPTSTTVPIAGGTIAVGTIVPLTGLFAAFGASATGMRAAFDWANANGGIAGRKLELVVADDAYDAAKTLGAAQQLLDQRNVVAIAGAIGTPDNLAIREEMNARCVPQLFVASGSSAWGQYQHYPWTIGGLIPVTAETTAYMADAAAVRPHGTVSVLYVDNEFGKEFLAAVRVSAARFGLTVAGTARVDPADTSVRTQVTTLAEGKADVLAIATGPAACPAAMKSVAESGWQPRMYLTANCANVAQVFRAADPAGNGVITSSNLKDLSDATTSADPDTAAYVAALHQYAPEANPASFAATGWHLGQLTIAALRQAAASPGGLTRASLMDAARNLSKVTTLLARPGITFTTTAVDGFPAEATQLVVYDAVLRRLVPTGPVLDFEGTITAAAP